MIKCLLAILCTFSLNANWEDYKKSIFEIHSQIPGWCNKEKANLILDLIADAKPVTCIEIGTFAGSSTFPILCGLHYLGRGMVYTIDPWQNYLCTEGLNITDPLISNWNHLNVDMNAVHQTFMNWLSQFSFNHYCTPLPLKSNQAVSFFADESIDLLYIDGNMSKHGSLQDAILYLPKVKEGGHIFLNADSRNKNLATGFLMKHCDWIQEKSIGIQFLLFRKTPKGE